MAATIDYLANAGWALLLGATVLLFIGWLGARFQHAPIARQRFGEGALVVCLLWLFVPLLPVDWNVPGSLSSSPNSTLFPVGEESTLPGDAYSDLDANSDLDLEDSVRLFEPRLSAEWNSLADTTQPETSVAPGGEFENTNPNLEIPVEESATRPGRDNLVAARQQPSEYPSTENSWPAVQSVESINDFGDLLADSALASLPTFAWPRKILGCIYLAGVLVTAAWLLLGHLLLLRLVRKCRPLPESMRSLVDSQDLPTKVRVVVSPGGGRIFAFGILIPTIVVPESMIPGEHRSQLKHVLLHEAGHVRQRDAVGQCLMNLALVFFWFHPVYWMLRASICFSRELVIDDWAASRSDKSKYVSDMIALARLQPVLVSGPTVALGAFGFPPSLFFRRIKMLVQRQSRLDTRTTRRKSFVYGTLLVALLMTTFVTVQVPPAIGQQSGDRISELKAKNQKLENQTDTLKSQLAEAMASLERMQQVTQALEERLAATESRMHNEMSVREAKLVDQHGRFGARRNTQGTQQRPYPDGSEHDPGGQAGATSQQTELLKRQQMFDQHMAELHAHHSQKMADLHREFEMSMEQLHQAHRQDDRKHEWNPPKEPTLETHLLPDAHFERPQMKKAIIELPKVEKATHKAHTIHEETFELDPESTTPQDPIQDRQPEPVLEQSIEQTVSSLPREEPPESKTNTGSFVDNDLFKIAMALSDVRAELDMLTIDMEGLTGDSEDSRIALRRVTAKRDSLTRKSEALRALAEFQIRNLELSLHRESQKLSHSEKLVERGFVPKSEIDEGKFRMESLNSQIRILQKILQE